MRVKVKEEDVGRRRRRPGRNSEWRGRVGRIGAGWARKLGEVKEGFAAEGSLVGPEAAGVGLGPTPGKFTWKAGAVIIKSWVVARYTVSPWGRTVALRTLRLPRASLTQDREVPL